MIGAEPRSRLFQRALALLMALAIALSVSGAFASGQYSALPLSQSAYNAAHLTVHPSSTTLSIDQTVTAEVWLDSGEPGAVIVTTLIEFDQGHLEVTDVSTTNTFGSDISVTTVQDANQTGVLSIKQAVTTGQDAVVGMHKIAEIAVRATSRTGTLYSDNFRISSTRSSVASADATWMTLTTSGARFQVGGDDTVAIFTNAGYGGTGYGWYEPTQENLVDYMWGASSIRIDPGWSARVFEQSDQRGGQRCYNSSDTDFSDDTFDNGSPVDGRVRSIAVYDQDECPVVPELPAAPSNLVATAVSASRIDLTWTDNSTNEQGFRLYRDGLLAASLGANTTSYQDVGLDCGRSYSYYVVAYNDDGTSGQSNTASATTVACPPTAGFDAWPLAGEVPLQVEFHNTSAGTVTSCSWEYGDGNTGTSCDSYHSHTYTAAGSYTVRLTVTGPGGSDTRQRSNYIDVAAPPPACDPTAEQVALYADTGYGGACVVLGLGDYPGGSHLGPLGDNNAESIKVGANVSAILYEHENYGGISELFTSYDSDLSDNLIGANRVSSMKVIPPDTEDPVVDWVAPVGNGGMYFVSDEVIQLEATASDNVGVARVRFFRWDAVNLEEVEIANVYSPPYQVLLDCSTLNFEDNEIDVQAYDTSGNVSSWKHIWLYRLPPQPDLKPYAPPGYQHPVVPSSVPGTHEVNALYAGQTTYFDWHFTNAGNAPAEGEFHVELWVGDTRHIRYPYSDFGAGWTGGLDDWMITIDEPGWHTVKLIVDPDGAIEESDESNNVWERDFYWMPSAPYFDDMESGTDGWTATGLWHLVDTSSLYHEAYSGSRSWWYGQDATGDYDTGGANSGDLTSPAVYIPDSGYYLRFRYWYETETQGPDWDQRWVQISVDGGEFIDVWHLYDDVQRWWLQSPAIDLSAYAGHTMQVRFRFDTLDAMYNDYRGWYIDDFDISSTPPPSCNDTHEPNDTPADATTISYGQTLYADICPPGDYDFYQFVGSAGDKVVVNVDAQVDGSWLDSFIYLLDSDGSTVLAFNDDEPTSYDSRLGYELPRDGTYYIKVRDYWHPSTGGPDYFYSIDLVTDDTPPSAEITSPQSGAWLDPNLEVITASATEDGSGVNRVEFLWHDGDWENSQWVWLGKDEDGSDGWEFPFDTSSEPEQQGAAFYVWAFDWAGNWTGAGAWSLGIDRTAPQVSAEVHQLYGDAPFRSFWVSWWNSSDNLSGVATYDVQYRDGTADPWTDLAIGTTHVFTRFVGLDGHTYYFRARARDHAGNQSTYAGGDGDAHHTVEICDVAPDAYEVDDTTGEASWIATDGVAQPRNFHTEADQDWAKFDAIGGITYTLRTSNTGGHGDTVLYLYDIDGSTLIDRNDDYPGMGLASRIDWQPPTDGIYYAKVEHWDAYAYGCTTAYDLSVGGCSRYDLNCTCQVDIADVQAVAARWRCEPGGCYEAKYDINDDGQIDVVDIMLVASRWGCGCGDECYNGGSPESAGSPNGASTDAEPSQVTAGPSASRREADDAVNLSTGVSPVDNRATLQSSRRYDPTVVRWR